MKSASLYADSVEVLSFSSLVYTDWGAIDPEEADALRRALASPNETGLLPKFTTNSDRIAANSGVNELLPAVRASLVTINNRLPAEGDVWGAFLNEIVCYLSGPEYVVLLDDRLSGLVSSHRPRPSHPDRTGHRWIDRGRAWRRAHRAAPELH